MAKTYRSEGRQLANFLKGIAALLAVLCLLFFDGAVRLILFFAVLIGGVIIAEILGAMWTRKRRSEGKGKKASASGNSSRTKSASNVKTDDDILGSRLSDLSGPEFKRLLALYFRDQGYTVHEVGVGGNDGGVDLVIVDRRGEKTAVQAKCYADHNLVPVQTVRELVGAKRNHDCVLSLLVTTSDLTAPAKKEAEQFRVEYWHGGVIEQKLRNWGKWKPGTAGKANKPKAVKRADVHVARRETAAAVDVICRCGAPMVRRKNKQGVEFWGCSTYPRCRHTRSE